jgi:hypothetical protein
MKEIFLSASVPVPGRGGYDRDADPFLIQLAVREFVTVVLGRRRIVWGGHPAITPMVWAVCEDLGVSYAKAVVLYQSRFFESMFPDENRYFNNVEYVDAVPDDREASLLQMREAMLSRPDLDTAVFIGGMEGIFEEHRIFAKHHPNHPVLALTAPGGAARKLADSLEPAMASDPDDIDFARLIYRWLQIDPTEPRVA